MLKFSIYIELITIQRIIQSIDLISFRNLSYAVKNCQKFKRNFGNWPENYCKICRKLTAICRKIQVKQYLIDFFYNIDENKKHVKNLRSWTKKNIFYFEWLKENFDSLIKSLWKIVFFLNFSTNISKISNYSPTIYHWKITLFFYKFSYFGEVNVPAIPITDASGD